MALAYAREGADVAIAYLNEHKDAEVCCIFPTLSECAHCLRHCPAERSEWQ